ncbi:MAG: CHASE2 domain-containing protein, partial [Verrucomicrobiota bacterium]
MKLKSVKLAPVLIAAFTITLACLLQSPFFNNRFDFLQQLEWKTYDQRVRLAQKFPRPCATNLAFVQIDEVTLKTLSGLTWPFPRQIHGKLVRDLAAQGAKSVGFDVLFPDLRGLDSPVLLQDNSIVESDDFFAQQVRLAGHVILAVEPDTTGRSTSPDEQAARRSQLVFPPPLFATNAMALGAITATSESDGVLRRVKPFTDDPEHGRIWHMGILLAAEELGLDLSKPVLESGRLILNGPNGVQRIIPVDNEGFFCIEWSMPPDDRRLTRLSYGMIILLDELRQSGKPDEYRQALEIFRRESGNTNLVGDAPFRGKLVVVGSKLVGNNVTDRGATPINNHDFLVSKHWNVANSVITNQFIRRTPPWFD